MNNIVPTDDEVELAAEMEVAMVMQRGLGEWPVTDEDRDIARAVLRHVNENRVQASTWNATPYRIAVSAEDIPEPGGNEK